MRVSDAASQMPTPPPTPATASVPPSGAYSIATAGLPSKASKPPVRRSVSASIRSTLPSSLATASVRPSGLIAKGGGKLSEVSRTNPVRNGTPSLRSPATSQTITLESSPAV